MGKPSASVPSAFLVGAVGNGTRGIIRSDKICCPATPNFVKHSCVKAWVKIDQLSVGRSTIGSVCVVGRATQKAIQRVLEKEPCTKSRSKYSKYPATIQ